MKKKLTSLALAVSLFFGGAVVSAPAEAHSASGHYKCASHSGWIYGPSGYRHWTLYIGQDGGDGYEYVEYWSVFFAGTWQVSHKHYLNCW